MSKLSIVIPVYNEEKTITAVLDEVLQASLSIGRELIIVDDGSHDDSARLIKQYKDQHPEAQIIFKQQKNQGKGSAVKHGIKEATGDIIIIQDADLEYDPCDYEKLIQPILKGQTKVVYGSRMLYREKHRSTAMKYYLGGRVVTILTNILYNSKLTDEPVCYKTFDAKLIQSLQINGNKFEWEPEITAKVLRLGIKIHEEPVAYKPRTHAEGKKINWKDGIQALWTLIVYRFVPKKYFYKEEHLR